MFEFNFELSKTRVFTNPLFSDQSCLVIVQSGVLFSDFERRQRGILTHAPYHFVYKWYKCRHIRYLYYIYLIYFKLFCIVSVQKWVLVLCFYLFSHANFSKYTLYFSWIYFSYTRFMSNLFWWMKNDTSIIKAYWFYIPRLLSFFVSIDVEQAVGMSSMLQALREERRRTEDAYKNT